MGASHSALSIQNPSQSGPRTQGDDTFDWDNVESEKSATVPGEQRAVIGNRNLPALSNATAWCVHMGRRSNVAFTQRNDVDQSNRLNGNSARWLLDDAHIDSSDNSLRPSLLTV